VQRGVIYARYSPGPNQREESIEGQLRECKKYAEEQGIQIIGSYEDRKVSGRTDNRTEFQRMMKDVERGLFDVIIVWKIDRFGRNREETAVNKIKCRKNGVAVLYAKEHIPEGPTGILLESMLEGLAEFYSAQLAENIIRGLTENALQAKATNGSVGLGYRVGENQKIEINETEAPTVRRVFEMFDEGFKYSEIIVKLNELGLKTRRNNAFDKNSISRILNNDRYIGTYRWRDIVIENAIPPIIEKELFLRCQEKMRKVSRAPGGGKAKVDYLLTGKLYCGLCEGSMSGESGHGKSGKTFNYYKCLTRKRKKGCKKETVKKEWVERLVAETVYNEVLMKDEVIESIADAVMRIQRSTHDGSLLASLEAQYGDVEKSIKNILRLVEQGTISASTNDRLVELEAAKEDIGGRIVAEQLTKVEITRNQVVAWLTRFRELDLSKLESQQKIIDAFVNAVYLYDNKIIIVGNHTERDGSREKITLEDLGLDGSGEDSKIEVLNGSSGGGGGVRITSPHLHLTEHIRTPIIFVTKKVFGIVLKLEK